MKVAIQGERGSNSHMAAESMPGLRAAQIVPCALSSDVFDALASGAADAAVLPIENSLHGSVAEHYDLLLEHNIRIDGEGLLRIVHNIIAAPGVALADVRQVLSHAVALSQCRRWLAAHRHIQPVAFYDTAGAVQHVLQAGLRNAAGVAPALAATEYGGEILAAGIEDNPENYTRFHLLRPAGAPLPAGDEPDKMSIAFTLEHRPGSLVAALAALAATGADLTRIESRPVHGRPWEYVFFVDFRFHGPQGTAALTALTPHCGMVRELGRYPAA